MAAVSAPLNGHVLSHQRSIEKDHSPWEFAIQNSQEVWWISTHCKASIVVKKIVDSVAFESWDNGNLICLRTLTFTLI